MEEGTFTDKLTLEDIAANDIEMTRDAIKNANKYNFGKDARKAMVFIKTCLDATLKHLGITVNPPVSKDGQALYAKLLDAALAKKQIKIENRNHYRGADNWRCGLYVYQKDELVAFISDVLTVRRTEVDPISMKLLKEDTGFVVVTNARVDDTKRIFLVH